MDTVSTGMVTAGKKVSLAALPIAAAFTLGFKSLNENEALLAQTNATITSMGNAANVSAQEVLDHANQISGYSGVAHEAIVEGQNMLLTFGNIKNEVGEGNQVFSEATELLTDMSVATGQDMQGAAVMLGKALNDPVKGLAAMSRVGIQFTKEQENMIKGMVESGDVMGAQKIILGELEKQFGGSAAALGTTMSGQLNITKNNFEALSRTMVTAVMPVLQSLTGIVGGVVNWFNNLSPSMQNTISKVLAFTAVLGPVLIVGGKLITAIKSIGLAFKAMSLIFAANPFVLLIAAVVALVAIIVLNWDKIVEFLSGVWEWIQETAAKVWEKVKDIFKAALDFVVNLFLNWTLPGLVIKHWETIKNAFKAAWDWIKNIFKAAIDFVVNLFLNWTLPGLVIQHWDAIKQTFLNAWEAIKTLVGNALEFVKGIIDTAIRGWQIIFGGFKDFLTGIWNTIKTVFSNAWNSIKETVSGAINTVKTIINTGLAIVRDVFSGAATFLRDIWRNTWNFIKEFPGKVIDFLKNIGRKFRDIGKAIIDGIIRGLGNIARTIYNKLKAGVQTAINRVKGFFGISSPSKVFAVEVGAPIMQGFALGIEREAAAARRKIEKVFAGTTAGISPAVNTPAFAGAGIGGGRPIIIHVHGSVVTETDLANKIADKLVLINRHRP